MTKYIAHPNDNYEIFINSDQDISAFLKNCFEYFNNWPNGKLPDYELPFQLNSVIAPKQILLLNKTENNLELLKNILKISSQYPLILESVYLLSKDWLEIDEHKIIKAYGEINYIFFETKLYKVFEKNIKIEKLLELNNLGSNIWLYRINI